MKPAKTLTRRETQAAGEALDARLAGPIDGSIDRKHYESAVDKLRGRFVLTLTEADRRVLLAAISEHTDGNARDLDEMALAGWSKPDAERLVALETDLKQATK